ncbi:uncharacterized protein LOC129599794 [Paramacrobiotus metropolitanus]|uniref:uncharacterized protein LOC129599794 n=1 Tax=Paramacrobiotus metropolitanus TaxID=2943436 RepID=UPI00244626B1|nr:uncharacterized protein LOC129599794 [Paramacrobiotus metropolitanus]
MEAFTSYPFRGLESGPCEINLANTVMVQRDNGDWWLGYVQDIDEDLMFVNFDSSTAPAGWIDSRHVRAQSLLNDDLCYKMDRKVAATGSYVVQVALRNTENGPHVFRSARLLTSTTAFGLFVVQLDQGITPQRLVVHLWQIAVAIDPVMDAPPLYNRTRGIYYRKFNVPFVNTGRITMLDMADICDCLDRAARTPANSSDGYYPGNDHVAYRVYVAVSGDHLKFICAQLQDENENNRAEWNLDTLTEACTNCYPTPDLPVLHDIVIDAPQQRLTFDNDGWIADVVYSVMAYVLFSLDLHTQAEAKRVCTLWHQLLSERCASRHVAIDFSIVEPNELINDSYGTPSCHNIFNLSWGFDKALTAETKSLTLLDNLQCTDLTIVTQVFVALMNVRGIQLDYILIKDGFSHPGITSLSDHVSVSDGHLAEREWKCHCLTKLSTVCRRLVLQNYTVGDITDPLEYLHRYDEVPRETLGLLSARFHPQERFQKVPVTIPYVMLQSEDGNASTLRQFLLAAERNLPPMDASMYNHVRSVHSRWVEILEYPSQWHCVRRVFQLYCGFQPDGGERTWTDVDLRLVDVSTLTKLTIAAINACFIVPQ